MSTSTPEHVARFRRAASKFTQIDPPYSHVYPGLRRGSALLCLGMVASIVVLGLTMPYYNKAASDMVSIYEALVFNSGLPQEFLVYPGVIGRVLLGGWLSVLHAVGIVSISRLEQLPVTVDLKIYEAAWQNLVEVGRVFSLGIGIVSVLSFVYLVRRWIGVWQIALLAGIALAFSSGVSLGFRILRPEMMAAGLVFSALLLVFIAAKDNSNWRFLKLALAGFLVALSVLEKVQSIIPALAILPLALAFGALGVAREDWRADRTPLWAAVLCAIALLAVWPAALIFKQGVADMLTQAATPYKALSGDLSGRYQVIVAMGIVASMAAYAAIWRVSFVQAIAGIAAVGLGLGIGFDLLYLQDSKAAIVAVANPIEHLQAYSFGIGATLLYQSPWAILQTIMSAIGKSLAIHTFVFAPTHRPTLLIEWLAWAGAFGAYRSGRTMLAFQIGLLLVCAIAEDAVFSLRQVKVYYLPYSDPPIILAGVLALSRFKHQIMTPNYQRAAMAMITVYIIWGHAQPALAVYSRHDRGKVCGVVTLFTKRIAIPYCKDAPGGGMTSVFDEL